MNPDPLTGWVALCLVPRIGGRTLSTLLDAFGSPRAIFEATEADLLRVARIGLKTVDAIRAIDLQVIEKQIIAWQAQGIRLLTWQDADYPQPLHQLYDRPPLLFARGDPAQDWRRVVAIVGTREPDADSVRLAETLAQELGGRGWLVVSGLALGIDAAAHRGALQAGGRTVAVLGGGVDTPHPAQNRPLGDQIMQKGMVFAEVPPGTPPSAGALMARNRLIAGLAKAVFVLACDLDSGSLETARRARQQQRHVFTVDHPDYLGNQALLRAEALPLSPTFGAFDALHAQLEALPDPPRQLSLFE